MRRTQKFLLAVFLLAVIGTAYYPREKNLASQFNETSSQAETSATLTRQPTNEQAAAPAAKASEESPISSPQKKNLEDMAQTLFQFTQPGVQVRDLFDYLEQSRQEPFIVRDENPDTGEMAIVRTKIPLPGTRYFHAQFMSDENKQGFVQHMSFEYRPGPTAMRDAVAAVEKMFPQLPAPQVRKDDFVRWNIDRNYIVWVKKMGAEDLQDDPFNAYSAEDVGTVRVAIEQEIHGADDQHSH